MADEQRQHLATALYDRLRAIARSRMAGQRAGHTLDPTGLANEAMLRLLNVDATQIKDEQHFLALAAEAMRQILVDHARRKTAQKRGGSGGGGTSRGPEPLENVGEDPAIQLRSDPLEVLALNEALTSLEQQDPDVATIVKMRAFVGMDCEEIAALMGTSRRTVERRWRYAMAELRERLSSGDAADEKPEPGGAAGRSDLP